MRRILSTAVVTLALLAVPGTASATTYCVHKGLSSCAGSDMGDNLGLALGAAHAHSGPDTVRIGRGTYSGPFVYTGAPGNPVEVVGAGEEDTVLTAPANPNTSVLWLSNSGGGLTHNEISGLEVRMPAASGGSGMVLDGRASHVRVEGPSEPTDSGVVLQGESSFENGAVSVGSGAIAIFAHVAVNTHARVDHSTVSGDVGIWAFGGGTVEVSQVGLTGASVGAKTQDSHLSLESSLIRMTSTSGIGYGVLASGGGKVEVVNSTIVGAGGGTGGEAFGYAGSGNAGLQVLNTILWNFDTDLACTGTNLASLTVGRSRFATVTSQGCGAWQDAGGNTTARPAFVDVTVSPLSPATDFRLRSRSPLIDTGALQFGSDVDLDGLARVRDGNGDGSLDIDMGAYEYQRRPPVAAVAAAPGQARAGTPIAFSAAGSRDPDAGDTLTYRWVFDDAASAGGSHVSHAFATAGAHAATLTVTDPTGLTASRTAAVTVTARPDPGAADTLAPVINRFSLSRHRFRVGHRRTTIAATRAGTTFRYRLSEAASVTITIRRRLRHRWRRTGSLRRKGAPGANRLRFSGRLGRRALRRGRYRARIDAVDSAGNQSAPKLLRFRVMR